MSPDETRATFRFAIRRDIAAGAARPVLQEWLMCSLSCTASFVLDATPSQKYVQACELRENLAADNDAMS